ncbi:sulfite dehydrogenase [Defluviimonas sp. WL0002]|uniref:Sulfite dehydrogenase n=1 Tax=Albidovulum marisflavi TaxID=2984159 RepID=A0ABT2Z8Z5_9RHOB|nr:sulfite dehydrogenase [Defluviimonas sp. WL0002]MCV2867490.1 sulfite dehydrogenase [Defluviimonas sp. WL0002]
MTHSSFNPTALDYVAGGGLMNRRSLLRAAAIGGGATFAGLTIPKGARADPLIPDWVKVAGARARGYGMPAEQEADVQRAIIEPYKEVAPSFSISGTPHQKLRGTITPSGLHYELHHGGRPDVDPDQHRLMIHGLVDRPLKFDLDSLGRYPMVTETHFLECAGNSLFNAIMPEPMQAGCDVLHGLLSNSEWTGIPMSVLLDEAGVKPEGRWVVAVGNDGPSLARSIPIEKLMDDAILALYQNGERVRPEQGYPMRLLVPGFEGNMNVKWLTSLWATDAPAHTKDESGEYTELLADGTSVEFTFGMGVKSIITHPSSTMTMTGNGFYEISGLAWSGAGPIRKVEISADGGASWAEAELVQPVLSRATTRFRLPWHWEGAPTLLMSRAEDLTGAVQPTRSDWKARYDPSNFLHNNAIQAWQITAEGMVQNVYA